MQKSPTLIDQKKLNKALMLHSKGELSPAKKLYFSLVKKYPNDPDINNYFGALHLQMQDPAKALPLLEKASRLKPSDADIFFNLGKAYVDNGLIEKAVQSYLQALKLNPLHNRANYNLGNVYKQSRDYEKAHYYLKVDVQIEPKHDAYCMLGEISVALNDYPQAKTYFSNALALDPKSPLLKSKVAAVAYHLAATASRLDKAELEQNVRQLDEAIVGCIKEDKITLLVLKADLLYLFGEVDEAIEQYMTAQQLGSLSADAYNSLGCALLTVGRFSEAWSYCHQRFNVTTFDVGAVSSKIACCSKPNWQGRIEPGKHLLVTSEQGIGDQLLHANNLITLHEAGMQVTVTCAAKLVGLMARCFPFAAVLPDCVPIPDCIDEQVDYQTNAITLSGHLLTDMNRIKPVQYLSPKTEWVDHFQKKYQQFGDKLKVGIAWRSKSGSCGARKSIDLAHWSRFLENDRIQCVSIQYGAMQADELELMRRAPFSKLYVDTDFDPYDDIEKAIAQIAALDVVVCVSNVGAHYAGLIGTPCWVLVAETTLWHWFLNTSQSPWYPSVHLERRNLGQSWGELLDGSYQKFIQHFVAPKQVKH